LQHDQKRAAAIGIERALEFCYALEVLFKVGCCLDMTCMAAVKAGVDFFEIDL